MRFPRYPEKIYPSGCEDIVGAYMRFIGENEPDNRDHITRLPRGNLRRASMCIGRACIIGLGDMEKAARITTGIRQELESNLPQGPAHKIQRLVSLTHLIEARGDKNKVRGVRLRMQRQGVGAMKKLQAEQGQLAKAASGKGAHDRKDRLLYAAGDRTEYRVLNTINRIGHPWLMALPSLEHHRERVGGEKTSKHLNFDSLVVEVGPHTDYQPLISKLQVTSRCFGECDRPGNADKLREGQRTREVLRAKYASDITLISGCCDLRYGTENSINIERFLTLERFEGLHPTNRPTLDAVTSHIMLLATGGEAAMRNGTFDPAQPATVMYSSGGWPT